MKVADFYDPTKGFNYYNVFWVVILLISIGTLIAYAMMPEGGSKSLAIIALSCGAILFGLLGVVFRIFYKEKWDYIAQGSTADIPDEGLSKLFGAHMDPLAPKKTN